METVRIGVVGVGGMGSGHVKCVQELPNCELTAVCDIDPAVCKAKAEETGVRGFTDYRELIASGLVDAITIATPHYDHPPIAVAAFEAGLHVLTEKPISVTVRAADEMIAAAQASGRKFAVMFQMRTEPVFRAAKKIVDEGGLGEIYRTNAVVAWYRSQAYYDSGGWRATWAGEGGGVLINQAPHMIDIFTWLAGLPTEIRGCVRTRLHDIEVEDEAFAALDYANGAHGYFYASTTEAPGTDALEIAGNLGKIRIQDGKLRYWRVTPGVAEHNREATEMWGGPKSEEVAVELPESKTGHRAVIDNFAEAILTDAPLIAPGPEGLNAMEMIDGIILSGRTGTPVSIPVDRDAYDAFIAEMKATSKEKTHLREQRVTDPQHRK